MRYLLTSSPCLEDGALNPLNGFMELLKRELVGARNALFISSDPVHHEQTAYFSGEMRQSFAKAGFAFESWEILDNMTAADTKAMIGCADFIILSGGHVPTQNAFFHRIGLSDMLGDFPGLIMGISAGTMNSAETVYAHPELAGEAVSPEYRRFLSGLGLTRTMVLPHYQMIKDDVLDGLRVLEDIVYPDSMGRAFYALPDGSFLYGDGAGEVLYGEAWHISDGRIEKFAEIGDVAPMH